MRTPTELSHRLGLGRKAVGALIAVGVALAAASPALADKWHNNGHGNKHWKHDHGYYTYYQSPPRVIYMKPAPTYYVERAPTYYVEPAPTYYVQPAPTYREPQINIVVPLDF